MNMLKIEEHGIFKKQALNMGTRKNKIQLMNIKMHQKQVKRLLY